MLIVQKIHYSSKIFPAFCPWSPTSSHPIRSLFSWILLDGQFVKRKKRFMAYFCPWPIRKELLAGPVPSDWSAEGIKWPTNDRKMWRGENNQKHIELFTLCFLGSQSHFKSCMNRTNFLVDFLDYRMKITEKFSKKILIILVLEPDLGPGFWKPLDRIRDPESDKSPGPEKSGVLQKRPEIHILWKILQKCRFLVLFFTNF